MVAHSWISIATQLLHIQNTSAEINPLPNKCCTSGCSYEQISDFFQGEVLEITHKYVALIQSIYNHLILFWGTVSICTYTQADRSSPSPSLSCSLIKAIAIS